MWTWVRRGDFSAASIWSDQILIFETYNLLLSMCTTSTVVKEKGKKFKRVLEVPFSTETRTSRKANDVDCSTEKRNSTNHPNEFACRIRICMWLCVAESFVFFYSRNTKKNIEKSFGKLSRSSGAHSFDDWRTEKFQNVNVFLCRQSNYAKGGGENKTWKI